MVKVKVVCCDDGIREVCMMWMDGCFRDMNCSCELVGWVVEYGCTGWMNGWMLAIVRLCGLSLLVKFCLVKDLIDDGILQRRRLLGKLVFKS